MGIGVTVLSDDRLDEELKRYGLEDTGGDPVDVLLLRIYANHEAALGAKDGTIASLESQNQALQERAEKAEALLLRLHGWDIMDVTSDGPYWQREIDQLLFPAQETGPETET